MTKEEVIEGNKLIDKFNEFYLKNLGFSDTELNYNTSWSCLMPVVEKIELVENDYGRVFGVHITNNHCTIQITNFTLDKITVELSHYFSSLYGNSKIEAVWLAIVEFIKWYNSCKKEYSENLY